MSCRGAFPTASSRPMIKASSNSKRVEGQRAAQCIAHVVARKPATPVSSRKRWEGSAEVYGDHEFKRAQSPGDRCRVATLPLNPTYRLPVRILIGSDAFRKYRKPA